MRFAIIFSGLFLVASTTEAMAQRGGGGREPTGETPASREFYEAKGLFATGLNVVFPKSVSCPGVSSPFGSATRYDGSSRRNDHFGIHNGMDISLEIGTPLLALTDGVVAHKGAAGRLVGNFIWLRFPPESTGLPAYVFARYQHLDQPTALNIGDFVKKGQVIGFSGTTGTTGGHYGAIGYPHLHLNIVVSPQKELEIRGAMMGGPDSVFLDPLGLFVTPAPAAITNAALRDLPEAKKHAAAAVVTDGGQTTPNGARIVWPVACAARH